MPFPLDIEYVRRAEDRLGVKLPLSYVSQMLKDNGGCVHVRDYVWWLFPIFDESDRKRLKRTCNDIVRESLSSRQRPHFPSNAVAIAHDGSRF